MTLHDRIAELAARVRRDADALIAEIDAGCPDGQRPNSYIAHYLPTAAGMLATAATEMAVEGLYVPVRTPTPVDRLIAALAPA